VKKKGEVQNAGMFFKKEFSSNRNVLQKGRFFKKECSLKRNVL